MAVAAVAIIVAVISLCLWARGFAGYHSGAVPGVYLALVIAAAAVTTVSAARGARAALAGPAVGYPTPLARTRAPDQRAITKCRRRRARRHPDASWCSLAVLVSRGIGWGG